MMKFKMYCDFGRFWLISKQAYQKLYIFINLFVKFDSKTTSLRYSILFCNATVATKHVAILMILRSGYEQYKEFEPFTTNNKLSQLQWETEMHFRSLRLTRKLNLSFCKKLFDLFICFDLFYVLFVYVKVFICNKYRATFTAEKQVLMLLVCNIYFL